MRIDMSFGFVYGGESEGGVVVAVALCSAMDEWVFVELSGGKILIAVSTFLKIK
jgi:hypothetical protein